MGSVSRSLLIIPGLLLATAAGHSLAQEPASAQGSALFTATCANCHGGSGQGGTLGPSILRRVLTDDDAALQAFLRSGNPEKGMPPVLLPEAELAELTQHLRYLAATFGSRADNLAAGQSTAIPAALADFTPLTEAMLLEPDPADWLWFSRTPDAQRFSPLEQINRDNVAQLGLAWSLGLPAGLTETIPTVYDGVMYLTLPGSNVVALDARNGDVLWEYQREYAGNAGGSGRSKTLAIYDDMIYFTAPDEHIVALDARSGAVRWEAAVPGRGNTSGAIVVAGKVLSSGTCGGRGGAKPATSPPTMPPAEN